VLETGLKGTRCSVYSADTVQWVVVDRRERSLRAGLNFAGFVKEK
jgi:hypothetical protein